MAQRSASIDEPGGSEDGLDRSGKGQPSRRFRFKAKASDDESNQDAVESHKRRRRRHHVSPDRDRDHDRKRRRSVRHRGRDDGPPLPSTARLPPDQAFRESLFDALADDEGAAFWEGVYGQAIHNYSDTYRDEDTGELERMTDDEYAQFVRRKMWEKSWEGIEAAKEEQRRRRAEEKQRQREEERTRFQAEQARRGDALFESQIEASLRRGAKRRDRKRWQQLWVGYLRRWDELKTWAQRRPTSSADDDDGDPVLLCDRIAWPVESGQRNDVGREEIERFVRKGTMSADVDGGHAELFATAVKMERVRWHPDKIQQRYGFLEIDANTLKGVTAAFQVFDAMWNELRTTAP